MGSWWLIVDNVKKMTVKKSCKYGRYVLFEQLPILFSSIWDKESFDHSLQILIFIECSWARVWKRSRKGSFRTTTAEILRTDVNHSLSATSTGLKMANSVNISNINSGPSSESHALPTFVRTANKKVKFDTAANCSGKVTIANKKVLVDTEKASVNSEKTTHGIEKAIIDKIVKRTNKKLLLTKGALTECADRDLTRTIHLPNFSIFYSQKATLIQNANSTRRFQGKDRNKSGAHHSNVAPPSSPPPNTLPLWIPPYVHIEWPQESLLIVVILILLHNLIHL